LGFAVKRAFSGSVVKSLKSTQAGKTEKNGRVSIKTQEGAGNQGLEKEGEVRGGSRMGWKSSFPKWKKDGREKPRWGGEKIF